MTETCICYTSHNLNTGKDEHTMARDCPVHLAEATTFYAELDRRCSSAAAITKMLRERKLDFHDYQGCYKDAQNLLMQLLAADDRRMIDGWDEHSYVELISPIVNGARSLLGMPAPDEEK
jgi:hypothetical protein